MGPTFQVPMQYRSLQPRTLLPSPVTSTTGYCCCFGSFSSVFLSFFLSLVGPQWGIRVQGLPLSGTRRWLCSCARCRAGLSGRSTPFSSGVISPLISSSILGTYRPGEFIFQCPIILPFHPVHGVLKVRILKWFAIPSPVDRILSELSTMTRLSWVALHVMAHSFTELNKAIVMWATSLVA